jgi:hypothetical protein
MPQVELERVTYGLSELREVMRDGYVRHFGRQPSDGELGYAWSCARLETGGKTWNNNFGNVKCSPSCQQKSTWVDISPLLKSPTRPPCPLDPSLPKPKGCEYPGQRAYDTGGEGATHWWKVLDGSRYDGVLELAAEGRAYDACYLMGERGYYEADKDWYSKQVESTDPPGPGPGPQPLPAQPGAGRWAALLLGVAVGWFGYIKVRPMIGR